ncbi:MAG: class I tRNA ligase family protein, partial [Natronomonas sp.]
LQDLCITRDMDWGIDYPDEDASDLVLYVWVDAPIEYVSSSKQYSERVGKDVYDWESVWKNQTDGTPPEGGEIVHIIGHDIIQHHTVFWPAMLRGADYNEPRAVMACGFVNLDGEAFSTSRNRAVWADDYVNSGLHPDLYRYHIVTGSEFEADVNFSWSGLAERTNNELVGTLGNFLYRSLLFAERNFGGTPDVATSDNVESRIEDAISSFEDAVNDYRVRGLGEVPIELARFGNEYIQRHEPWNLIDDDPEAAASVIRDCVQLSKAIAVLAEPLLPGKAADLWDQLGESESVHDADLKAALEEPPETFTEPEELFEPIEDERVDELERELEERIEAAIDDSGESSSEESETDVTTVDLEPIIDDRVDFGTFQDLDVRIGEILSVEPIEGADELVKLEVDIGVETRQIVAGIKQLHDLDSLPGTRIVVLANLEKAELFGVESDGMLLAAGEDADLLTTQGDSPPGTKVQ